MKTLLLLCLVLPFSACTKKNLESTATRSPEEVVRVFVNQSVGSESVEDRKKLADLCSGDMRGAFEKMSDENFRLSYINSKLSLKDFKILETNVGNEEARVVYQVTIDNPTGTEPTEEVNEREVELKRISGQWLVTNIRLRGSDKVAFTRGMIF